MCYMLCDVQKKGASAHAYTLLSTDLRHACFTRTASLLMCFVCASPNTTFNIDHFHLTVRLDTLQTAS